MSQCLATEFADPGHAPWQWLAGRSGPATDKGKLICACLEVGENDIRRAVADGCCTVQALGTRLGCGTNCGSCIPELNALIDSQALLV